MLDKNKVYYNFSEKIAQKLFDEGLFEDCVNYIRKISFYSWLNFHGIYYSCLFEKMLADIGSFLPSFDLRKIKLTPHSRRKALHICSEVYTSGGHSKLLYNWILVDKDSDHFVISTRMSHDAFLNVSNSYLDSEKYNLVTLTSTTSLGKAKELKEFLYNNFDVVILHIHPDDPIPNIVFSDPKIQIPVLFLNHADHTFWLGSSITDIVLQTRSFYVDLDKERRGIDVGFYLPIPIKYPEILEPLCAGENKQRVSILSIGNEAKYVPTIEYNFCAAMHKLVLEYENLTVNLIGISEQAEFVQKFCHPRIKYLGELPHENVEEYRKSCDLYVEGFPTPSFTAMLETVGYNKPFVLHYNPKLVYRLFRDSVNDCIIYPRDISEWSLLIKRMIVDTEFRNNIREVQTRFVRREFSLGKWTERLENLYFIAQNTVHKVSLPSEQKFYEGEDEKLVSRSFSVTIDHLPFTENLPFFFRVRMLLYPLNNSVHVRAYTLKQMLSYLMPQKLKKMLLLLLAK